MRHFASVLPSLLLSLFIPHLPAQLAVGDDAPALHIAHWARGEAFKLSADRDKVYVVEFWATWCGPCKTSIPHLGRLQKRLADRGVKVVGISREDKATVQPYVDGNAAMSYSVGVDDAGKTSAVWMKGVSGIPHAFVVAKGKIAWKGHPMAGMDRVVEQLVAGKFDPEHQKKVADLQGQMMQLLNRNDLGGGEKLVRQLIKLDSGQPQHFRILALVLSRQERLAEIPAAWAEMVQSCGQDGNALHTAADILVTMDLPLRAPGLALKAARRAVATGGESDPDRLQTLAMALYHTGQLKEAIRWQQKAVAALVPQAAADAKQRLEYFRRALAAAAEPAKTDGK